MPIGEAHIHVECDKCGEVSDPYELTMLAGQPVGWDTRDLPRKLERDGWKISGEETICSACASLAQDE